MKEIKIKITDVEYRVRQSYRALMEFEILTGKSVFQLDNSLNNNIKLFYCILKANNRETFNYTYDEFIDVLDDNINLIEVFTEFLSGQEEGKEDKKKVK